MFILRLGYPGCYSRTNISSEDFCKKYFVEIQKMLLTASVPIAFFKRGKCFM